MSFKIKLIDINPDVTEQFELQFSRYQNIEVIQGYFEEVEKYDCLVSPANSFGMMDGGIDAAIIDFFGKKLEKNVQNYIIENYSGEQPVGTSFVISTQHPKHPFLAHTPTMRIPQNIVGTSNVYYAMKALLSEVERFNKRNNNAIKTVLCPGMGTYIGEVSPFIAVRQMALAYEHFLNPPYRINSYFIYDRLSEIKFASEEE